MRTYAPRVHLIGPRYTLNNIMAVRADAADLQELPDPIYSGIVDILSVGMAVR